MITHSDAGSQWQLRLATIDDLDAILHIETSVFTTDAWNRGMLLDELTADHRHYLALVDGAGNVHGYGGLLVVGAEGDIQTIAVTEAARGHGHGRLIMSALLAEAASRGVREIFLEVRADNPVAQQLYLSLGFQEIGIRPGYYQPDNVDALVMTLNTKEAA